MWTFLVSGLPNHTDYLDVSQLNRLVEPIGLVRLACRTAQLRARPGLESTRTPASCSPECSWNA